MQITLKRLKKVRGESKDAEVESLQWLKKNKKQSTYSLFIYIKGHVCLNQHMIFTNFLSYTRNYSGTGHIGEERVPGLEEYASCRGQVNSDYNMGSAMTEE